jgi:hypothetical protein
MNGFPGGPPSFCGPAGPLGSIADGTANIVKDSYGTMCNAYNYTCDVGVIQTVKIGGHGLVATFCPDTTVLSAASCAAPMAASPPERVAPFKDETGYLKNQVKYNNVRYGISSAQEDEVIGFSAPSMVKPDTCNYTFYDGFNPLTKPGESDHWHQVSGIKFLPPMPQSRLSIPSKEVQYPRFVRNPIHVPPHLGLNVASQSAPPQPRLKPASNPPHDLSGTIR